MIQSLFTPGRTELAGNHTDHQNGRNLAGAIDRGITARFQANDTKTVRLRSKGMGEVELRCDQLQPRTAELGTAAAACSLSQPGGTEGMRDYAATMALYNELRQ